MLRNRIIFSVLLISSSLLAYYLPNLFTSIFFHAMVYLLLFLLIHLFYSYKKIIISQELEPTVVEHGHTSYYSCYVDNEGFLPTSIIIVRFLYDEDMFKDQLNQQVFTLRGYQNKEFEYTLTFKYRGLYSVGIDTVEIADILNIFKIKIRNVKPKKITVLPKVTELPNFDLSPRLESTIKAAYSTGGKDATSFTDVRKYEHGDAIKRIHWKLSARHNELLVKNLEKSNQSPTMIFLDTEKSEESFAKNIIAEDKLLESLVSIVNQRLRKNHRVEVVYQEENLTELQYIYKDDFKYFFKTIASVTFDYKKDISVILDEYFDGKFDKKDLNGKDIFIFTCNKHDFEESAVIRHLLNNHCSLHIVYCSHDIKRSRVYRTRKGIYHYDLIPNSNVQNIFSRRA